MLLIGKQVHVEHMAVDIEGLELKLQKLPFHFPHYSDWRNSSWLILLCCLMTIQKAFGNP